jgi:D-xylono/L-arabinono-1,4-lactonase
MDSHLVTIAADVHCELGENPLWDPAQRRVYWTDIPAGRILRLDVASGKHEVIYQGPPVGGFTFQENGDLLLFRVNDLALLHPDGRVSLAQKFSDAGLSRFNDVIADPEGRVFAGSIGETRETGGLYRVERDGSFTRLFAGTGCSNGMGFSPDLKTFYWTCSTTRQIFQFDYDRSAGTLGNRRLFYKATPDEGIPDGLTVDAEGFVWSARWGGAAILRHGLDGKVLDRIPFPVPNITSMCFGGDHLDQLFVTSAQAQGENTRAAGALFHVQVKVRGPREFKSRIASEPTAA